MRSHLKVYFSFEEDTQALNDGEKGRLLLAMVRYAKDGTEVSLTGNERFLFPVFKAQIDRDIETYEVKVNNGCKGGRPKSKGNQTIANDIKGNQIEANGTEENQTKPNETETLKIEDRRQKIEDRRQKICRERFTPPTLEEVTDYCKERNNSVSPQKFINFYASKGWKVGNQPMKDWKACVRTWESREDKPKIKAVVAQNYEQRNYDSEQEEALKRMVAKMEAG